MIPVTLWQSSPLPRPERFCPNVSGNLPSLCQSCRVSAEKQNTSSPIFQMKKPCHSCFQFVAQRSRSFHRFLESGQCMINIVKMIMIIQWSVWSGIDGFSKLLPIYGLCIQFIKLGSDIKSLIHCWTVRCDAKRPWYRGTWNSRGHRGWLEQRHWRSCGCGQNQAPLSPEEGDKVTLLLTAVTLLKTILSAILKESLAPLRPPSLALLYSSPVFFAQLPKAFLKPVLAFPTWILPFIFLLTAFFSPGSFSPGPSPTPWAPQRTQWAGPPLGWLPRCPSRRLCWQSRRCQGTGWPWRCPWCLPPRGRGEGRRRISPGGREGHSESREFWGKNIMMTGSAYCSMCFKI